jgi:hypothetical protein
MPRKVAQVGTQGAADSDTKEMRGARANHRLEFG